MAWSKLSVVYLHPGGVNVIFCVAGFGLGRRWTMGAEPFSDTHERARSHIFCMGMLKTNGPPFRMGQAMRSRHFAVLTYSVYAPRVNIKVFPFGIKLSNFALRDAASNTVALLDDFFEHSRWLLIWTLR